MILPYQGLGWKLHIGFQTFLCKNLPSQSLLLRSPCAILQVPSDLTSEGLLCSSWDWFSVLLHETVCQGAGDCDDHLKRLSPVWDDILVLLVFHCLKVLPHIFYSILILFGMGNLVWYQIIHYSQKENLLLYKYLLKGQISQAMKAINTYVTP